MKLVLAVVSMPFLPFLNAIIGCGWAIILALLFRISDCWTFMKIKCLRKMADSATPSPTVDELHTLMINTSPPSKPGAPQIRIFINKDLSLLAPSNSYNEVYPGIFIGDKDFARDKRALVLEGITHLINAAEGHLFHQVNTYQGYYASEGIKYLGVRARDSARFKMEVHFHSAADFIQEALDSGGAVGVNCVVGMSRSASLVIGYLMIKHRIRLVDAIVIIRKKRAVFPNDGFLKQLVELDQKLFL